MNPRILLLLVFFNPLLSFAQTDSAMISKPKAYPGWSFWLPGATHFLDGRPAEGIAFATLEVSGLVSGIVLDKKLRTESSSPYYNFPLLIGMQAYNVDKTDWLRQQLKLLKYYQPDFKYDPITFRELLKAPYQPKNFFTPINGGFIALALGQLLLANRFAEYTYADVDKMYLVNKWIPKNDALAVYGTVSMAAAFGAGVGEEYYFRNGFMPIWDYKYGQKKGLIFSSLFFGSMHLGNLLFSSNPDIPGTLLQVAEASIAGYILGRDVQKRGYNIGPAVAAHTWYDFTLMLGSFLIDPKNNFLGVNMFFKL